MIKIVDKNAFYLRMTGKTRIGEYETTLDMNVIDSLIVNFVRRGRIPQTYTIDANNRVRAYNSGILAKGVYGVEFVGYYNGQPWRHFASEIFAIVDDNGTEPDSTISNIDVFDVTIYMKLSGDGVTADFVQAMMEEHNADALAHTEIRSEIPGNVSDLHNDVGFQTEQQVRQQVSTSIEASKINQVQVDVVENGGQISADGSVNGQKLNLILRNFKGEKGDDGDPLTFEDLTDIQKAELKGEPGDSVLVGQGDLPLAHVLGDDNTKAISQQGITNAVKPTIDNVALLYESTTPTLTFTDKKKLISENDVATIGSQANVSVTSVNISAYQKIEFTIYKAALSAGSGSGLLWAITDSSNNILDCSEAIAIKTGTCPLTKVSKILPTEAAKLYIMTSTNDKAKITLTGTTFVPPANVKNVMDYVEDKKESIDIFGEMVVKESITPTWNPNSNSAGRVIGLANGKYSMQSNSIANSVANINVEGVLRVNFNASIYGGGSYTKTQFVFNDEDGNNILIGDTISGASALGVASFEMNVPEGAKTLLISMRNADIANYGSVTLTKINIPEAAVQKERTYDIENSAVKAFRHIKYDNSDYSYSWVTKLKAMNANYDVPNPITIDTPVDGEAVSRNLIIADNSSFTDAWVIELDLVSKTKDIYNLEPQKWYWWKVCKDNDATEILDQGKFFCEGQIRELRIGASYTEAQVAHTNIQNARDIGGWPADGGRMRYGVLFRGHELDNSGVDSVTAAGKAELLRLGVGVELDLRGSSAKTSPIGNDVVCVRIGADLWFHHLSIYQSQLTLNEVAGFAAAVRAVIKAAKAKKAVYAHCQGGCDRTGALCWIIEGLCGVSENDLTKDFELSDRPRNNEYLSRKAGDARDSDYKFAMDYVKGLLRYENHIYTKSRCYDDTYVTIGGVDYKRSTYETVDGITYYAWNNSDSGVSYYTTEVYPNTYSKVYEYEFEYTESEAVITKVVDKFWYDAQAVTHGLSAARITDASLIGALNAAVKPKTLQEKFVLLMQIDTTNGLTNEEIEDLRQIFIA